MKDAASDLIIIDCDGKTFVSIEYVERIPTTPSDLSIKDRFYSASVDFPESACIIRCRQNKQFISLHYLNRILSASGTAQPLQVKLAIQTDSGGDEHIVLGLQDLHGSNVPLKDPKSAQHDPWQVVIDQKSVKTVGCGHSASHIDVKSQQELTPAETPLAIRGAWGQQIHRQSCQHRENVSQNVNSSIKKLAFSSRHCSGQQQIASRESATTPATHISGTEPPSVFQRRKIVAQSPKLSHMIPLLNGMKIPSTFLNGSHSVGRSSQWKSSALWKQLQDVKMTDIDVLKAFSRQRFPEAISVLANAPNVIPLGILTTQDGNYSIKPFKSALWAPKNLGIPKAKSEANSLKDHQLLAKITTFCTEAEELRQIVRDNFKSLEGSTQSSITERRDAQIMKAGAEDPESGEKILSRLSSHPHHTIETCVPRARHFTEHCSTLLRLQSLGSCGYNAACNVKKRADEVLKYVAVWKDNSDGLVSVTGLNRLVRKAVVSEAVSISVEYPLPRYVLPLGRLCRVDDMTDLPTELDEILVMDITSPRKALWRFRFLGPSISSCYSFEMLAADIRDICPNSEANGEKGGPVERDELQVDEARVSLMANKFPWGYPDSRVDFVPGGLAFTYSTEKDYAEAIRQGWKAVRPAKTRKREEGDNGPQRSKRKRDTS